MCSSVSQSHRIQISTIKNPQTKIRATLLGLGFRQHRPFNVRAYVFRAYTTATITSHIWQETLELNHATTFIRSTPLHNYRQITSAPDVTPGRNAPRRNCITGPTRTPIELNEAPARSFCHGFVFIFHSSRLPRRGMHGIAHDECS